MIIVGIPDRPDLAVDEFSDSKVRMLKDKPMDMGLVSDTKRTL